MKPSEVTPELRLQLVATLIAGLLAVPGRSPSDSTLDFAVKWTDRLIERVLDEDGEES